MQTAGDADVKRLVPSGPPGRAAEERRILGCITTGVPLRETLDLIARLMEREAPDFWASILVLEGKNLRHGAAPSLPDEYNRAIDGLEIGPGVGSCGTSAFTGRPCVVEDIMAHPYWIPFRPLAKAAGVRACWSAPILGRGGEVLGTFALYHREPRGPRPEEARLVDDAAHLASLAIQHDRVVRAEASRLADERDRARLRDILSRAPMPVALLMGPDFVYEFVNPAYEALVRRRGLEGQKIQEAFPEIEQQGVIKLLRSIYETGVLYQDAEMRVELERGAGLEECWFNLRIDPYLDDEGTVIGLFVLGVEVTATVRARHDLDARRAELAIREKTSALGQLVSGVAHEIRTPLTYLATNMNLIQLRLERLVKGMPPTQADAARMLIDQYIPTALEAVDRINHIVEDLREFTQLRHGVREPVSFKTIVTQAVDLFQATNRGRVTVRVERMTDTTLVLDRLHVQQAVLNLLQNAMEAEPRDHVIRVSADLEGERAIIRVSDTGRGIPVEAQGRVFDPFFTTREAGTGLGLSIVKRVIEEHRGSVTFDTGPEGTTFQVTLPLASQTKS